MNKNVMISGAGSGFGQLTAILLSDRGHQVIATTETEQQARDLRELAPLMRVEKLDITTEDIHMAEGWDVDVLINNAGRSNGTHCRHPHGPHPPPLRGQRLWHVGSLSGRP